VNFLERQLEDPVRRRRLKRLAYSVLAVVALTEAALPRILHGDKAHFSFEEIPAWGSIYGLISCVAIIVVSKIIGKLWLMRREDYYDS
jgi:hypothetical protein